MRTTETIFSKTYEAGTSTITIRRDENPETGRQFHYLEERSGNCTSGVIRISAAKFEFLKSQLEAGKTSYEDLTEAWERKGQVLPEGETKGPDAPKQVSEEEVEFPEVIKVEAYSLETTKELYKLIRNKGLQLSGSEVLTFVKERPADIKSFLEQELTPAQAAEKILEYISSPSTFKFSLRPHIDQADELYRALLSGETVERIADDGRDWYILTRLPEGRKDEENFRIYESFNSIDSGFALARRSFGNVRTARKEFREYVEDQRIAVYRIRKHVTKKLKA